MNGRKAKRLRRLAEEVTMGWPSHSYEAVVTNPKKPHRPTFRLLGRCTRRVYKCLKKLNA